MFMSKGIETLILMSKGIETLILMGREVVGMSIDWEGAGTLELGAGMADQL